MLFKLRSVGISVFLYVLFRAEVGTIFALSWLITWFGHVLSDFRHVVRLYDFFLACHPLMPIYFAAVVRFPPSDFLKASLILRRSGSADSGEAIFRLCRVVESE